MLADKVALSWFVRLHQRSKDVSSGKKARLRGWL